MAKVRIGGKEYQSEPTDLVHGVNLVPIKTEKHTRYVVVGSGRRSGACTRKARLAGSEPTVPRLSEDRRRKLLRARGVSEGKVTLAYAAGSATILLSVAVILPSRTPPRDWSDRER